ncbi:MAG TPA: hypothetical protein VHD83_15475 [Puia sp.]|nr:hypothetical protein [Puia sp.]
MNFIVFLIRVFGGLTFLIMTGISVDRNASGDTPNWHPNPVAAILSLTLTILYFWPLFVEVRHKNLVTRMPTGQSLTTRRVLTFWRWFMAYILGMATVSYALELHFDCGILSLIPVVALMPPLDRLVFEPREQMAVRLKGDATLLKFFANLGAVAAFVAIGFYAQKDYIGAIAVLWVSISLLLMLPVTIVAKEGWKALALPALPPAPVPQPVTVRTSPTPATTTQPPATAATMQPPSASTQTPPPATGMTNPASHTPLPTGMRRVPAPPQPVQIFGNRVSQSDPQPSPPPPSPKPGAKRKYYSADAWHWNWPLPKGAQHFSLDEWTFNLLIRGFQTSWLESKDYHQRLTLHRNPAEFIKEIIAETEAYIKHMRTRIELQTRSKSCVPDEVGRIWQGDKRLRSLYRAVHRYDETRQSIRPISLIAPHIAEYRAMVNVVKRLKHKLSCLPGQAPASKTRRTTRAVTPPAPSPEQRYFEILDYLIAVGKNLEHYPDNSKKSFDEQGYRDYFIPGLNTRDPEYSAKGEVYNRRGKTDILVFDKKGNNLLIAECKLWKGEAYLLEGVDQLLYRYVNWRDEKTAIIIFNRDVKNFTAVIETATAALSNHPLCHQKGRKRTDCSWSYLFHNPDDNARVIKLELILLNFS